MWSGARSLQKKPPRSVHLIYYLVTRRSRRKRTKPAACFIIMQLLQRTACMYVSKCIMHREYTTISTQNCTSAPYSISYIIVAAFLAKFAIPLLLVFLRTNSAHACYWGCMLEISSQSKRLTGFSGLDIDCVSQNISSPETREINLRGLPVSSNLLEVFLSITCFNSFFLFSSI